MNLQRLVMIGFSESDFSSEQWKRIRVAAGQEVRVPKDSSELPKLLSDADAVTVRLGAAFDAAMIDAAPKLTYIGMYGTGYGRIDIGHAAAKRIVVTNVPNYSTQGVAELVFGLLIARFRDLQRAAFQASHGDYSEATFTGTELGGKVFGILGLGNIGRRVAEIATAGFGCKVVYWSRTRKPEVETSQIVYASPEDTIRQSNILSLHMAYVPETKEFLNATRVALLQRGATLINVSPMELLDLNALCSRLATKDLALMLDHSDEMLPADLKRLSAYESCHIYPPIGYTTIESTARKQDIFVRNIESFVVGKPQNKVN